MQYKHKKKFTGILLAAGNGKRFSNELSQVFWPKQFLVIQDKKTILEVSLEKIAPFASKVVVALPSFFFEGGKNNEVEFDLKTLINKLQIICKQKNTELVLVPGGKERQNSVESCLTKVETEYLFVHDAARPLVHNLDLERLLNLTIEKDAAILAKPIVDTVKKIKENSESSGSAFIKETLDRTKLWNAETPQAFLTDLYINCFEQAKIQNLQVTDDASIIEMTSNSEVHLVESKHPNFKITTQTDFLIAQALFDLV
ncbi:MAG TPA: 2-C-methyl-D-erythritol 4-phosphate cytidylyltransferase [Vampirovibrionales bacterium]